MFEISKMAAFTVKNVAFFMFDVLYLFVFKAIILTNAKVT